MKTIILSLFLCATCVMQGLSQRFELHDLPSGLRHVEFTRFEVHQDTMFFLLYSPATTPVNYYLAKFHRRRLSVVPLPSGYLPTRYHLASYRNHLYIVLKNPSDDRFLFRYDGYSFEQIKVPFNHSFTSFEELETYNNELYLGLKNNATNNTVLSRYDGSVFNSVPLCADCLIGINPGTVENTYDEMIVYKNKLYLVGHLVLDETTAEYPERLLVWDGTTTTIAPLAFRQWGSIHDQFFINNDLLHTLTTYGFDGTSVVPIHYYYPTMTMVDPVEMPWASPNGTSLGKAVYNGAVYNSAYIPFASDEVLFLRRRLYSFSTTPSKAREIFLPDDYFFGGFESFHSHLIVYNCRLFMFLDHPSGIQKLASYKDTPFSHCDLILPHFPTLPWPIHIYPNPGNGLFKIELPEVIEKTPAFIKVFNDKGKIILEKTITDPADNELDLRSYGKGLYTIQINNGKPIRLVVNH
jgi:hypothetical protein